jgi:hypothetical protein
VYNYYTVSTAMSTPTEAAVKAQLKCPRYRLV